MAASNQKMSDIHFFYSIQADVNKGIIIMDKDKILQKSRTEKNNEFEKKVHIDGQTFGIYVINCVCVLFTAINIIFLKINNVFDYGAILMAFASSSLFHRFIKTKKKAYLIGSIVCFLVFAFALTSYIIFALKQ